MKDFLSYKLNIRVDWKGYRSWGPVLFAKKIGTAVFLLLAAAVLLLNARLMFDNVLWGDEAFAASAIHNNLAGIFQILTLIENHPPLYYLWLKLFAELFGYSGWVYHFASFVPFAVGVVFAVTLFRKRFGKLPSAFFLVISGLSAPCLEYNMEIRMYALAFLGLAGAFYCGVRVLEENRLLSWAGMVFWALVAAYSHYYALVAAGLFLFFIGLFAALIYGGRRWMGGVASILVFLLAYAPWLRYLFRAMGVVKRGWWNTENDSIRRCLPLASGGMRMSKVILGVLFVMVLLLFVWESRMLEISRKEKEVFVRVIPPRFSDWNKRSYGVWAGLCTVGGTFVGGYILSALLSPIVAARYFYPLSGIVALLLVIELSRLLELTQNGVIRSEGAGICCVLAVFALLGVLGLFGLKDYKDYQGRVASEKAATEEVLYLIGEPTEETVFVNNGVKHLGWTVLGYYFPDNEIRNGGLGECEGNDVWYFTKDFLDENAFLEMSARGYNISGYGEKQLVKYPMVLYHFER